MKKYKCETCPKWEPCHKAISDYDRGVEEGKRQAIQNLRINLIMDRKIAEEKIWRINIALTMI
jgi:hypothetical protein